MVKSKKYFVKSLMRLLKGKREYIYDNFKHLVIFLLEKIDKTFVDNKCKKPGYFG